MIKFVAALLFVAVAVQGLAFDHVSAPLPNLQDPSGGFRAAYSDALPSAHATASGLFLSSLYGLGKEINTLEAPQFLESLLNKDGGYARVAGEPSSIDATRQVVRAYEYLGIPVPAAAQTIAFVRSTFDAEAKQFADRVGGRGRVRSSAQAIEVLATLSGLTDKAVASDIVPALKAALKEAAKGDHFEFANEAADTEANTAAITIASLIGFDLGKDLSAWAAYVASFQNTKESSQGAGGFFASKDRTIVNVESTSASVAALATLEGLAGSKTFVSLINSEALLAYARGLRLNLVTAALAHRAVALTPLFTSLIKVDIEYQSAAGRSDVGDRIIQGSSIRPYAIVMYESVSNSGLEVSLTVAYPSGSPSTYALQWDDHNEAYFSPQLVNTAGHLGAISFEFKFSTYVVGVGALSWTRKDVKTIGYGLEVKAASTFAGRSVAEGEAVGVGATFDFGVSLYTATEKALRSGDFVVTLSVLDSSESVIHTESLDGSKNTGAIAFKYELTSSVVPAGSLYFRFEVAAAGKGSAPHTTVTKAYTLAISMVASQVAFVGATGRSPSFKFGDKVTVAMEPGNLPDLRTFNGFSYSSAVAGRKFVMIVSTTKGVEIASVPGVGSSSGAGGKAKYTFSFDIPAALESMGSNTISFAYVPAHGAPVVLDFFDGENREDSASLSYTVSADLYLSDVKEMPKAGDFSYGNQVTVRFSVKDAVSDKYVGSGSSEARIFLTLEHEVEGSKGRSVSVRLPVTQVEGGSASDGFVASWVINPNAVMGKGFLELSAVNADGASVPLYKDKSKGAKVSIPVNIGGAIDVKHTSFTLDSNRLTTATAFVSEFSLFCKENELKDANLRAVVLSPSGDELLRLPVSKTTDSARYQVSWSLPSGAAGGNYLVQFYREVDRNQAEDAQPLFSITLAHASSSDISLPLRPQYIVLLLTAVVFFFAHTKKGSL